VLKVYENEFLIGKKGLALFEKKLEIEKPKPEVHPNDLLEMVVSNFNNLFGLGTTFGDHITFKVLVENGFIVEGDQISRLEECKANYYSNFSLNPFVAKQQRLEHKRLQENKEKELFFFNNHIKTFLVLDVFEGWKAKQLFPNIKNGKLILTKND
jgi:hypothetical protein